MIRVIDGPREWVTKDRCCFFERDPVACPVATILGRIPLELHADDSTASRFLCPSGLTVRGSPARTAREEYSSGETEAAVRVRCNR
jgi:hypothetical protein